MPSVDRAVPPANNPQPGSTSGSRGHWRTHLRHTLPITGGAIGRIAWSPDGTMLAVPTLDGTVSLWSSESGTRLRTLTWNGSPAHMCAFNADGTILAIGHANGVDFVDARYGRLARRLSGPNSVVAFESSGDRVATAADGIVRLAFFVDDAVIWKKRTGSVRDLDLAFSPRGDLLATVGSSAGLAVYDVFDGSSTPATSRRGSASAVAFSQNGLLMAYATGGGAIVVLDPYTGATVATLEGHSAAVTALAFAPFGAVLASAGDDGATRLWRTTDWTLVCTIAGSPDEGRHGVAFHPIRPCLATTSRRAGSQRVSIYDLNLDFLLGTAATLPAVRYTSAKIVLVGDSGVGKTGLGWRLSHWEFKEHVSTHGQQFWLLDDLGTTRADGAQCEAVLWDFAGQPDYRLTHALHSRDAELALVVFDPTRDDDPLRTVDYWLRQLRAGQKGAPKVILVAARADRGGPRMTDDEIQAYCRSHGISNFVTTSALSGLGLDQLITSMKAAIDWDSHSSTITTQTFKQIKDYVLGLKEARRSQQVIMSPTDLRARLERDLIAGAFTDAELITAVNNLANHGYVTWLRSSTGERSVLLAPELLNNLAASIVLEARRNPKGLGSLEEKPLLSGEFQFPELGGLSTGEHDMMLDSAVVMFLTSAVCFRSADPLSGRTYLVFPDLINLQRPSLMDDIEVEETVSYGVTGATENLYASLVVLLGYTSTFARTDQWRNHARYVMGGDLVCDLRVEPEPSGELTFVLSYGLNVGTNVRTLFQSLVESLLTRPDLAVRRYQQIACSHGHPLARTVMRERLPAGFAFCPSCGERLALPNADVPIELTTQQEAATAVDRRVADDRSRFEEAVFRLVTYVKREGPTCFISYAWGKAEQERWVERSLATDLVKAGVRVILDQWESTRAGKSMPRFVERIHAAARVIVVGTPAYRTKYLNKEPMGSFVVAAEGDLIGFRMIGTEEQKESVLPVLLEGDPASSLPPLLLPRTYADLRDPSRYFVAAFDLMLSLYEIDHRDPAIAELRREVAGEAR